MYILVGSNRERDREKITVGESYTNLESHRKGQRQLKASLLRGGKSNPGNICGRVNYVLGNPVSLEKHARTKSGHGSMEDK